MEGAFGNSDYIKAFELFKKSANEKPSSEYNVFRTPISRPDDNMDCEKLVEVFMLASVRGEKEICYNIGYLYENGLNVKTKVLFYPNYTDAVHWYSVAATNGDSRAKFRLGIMYEEGKGVEVDLTEAYNYYLEAYENGIDEAAYRLAFMCMSGKGVGQDLLKAYYLFTEVSNKGHKKAYTELTLTDFGLVHKHFFLYLYFASYKQFNECSICSNNLNMLEAVANIGYIAIQYQLGVFYQEKEDDGSDQQAIKWLTMTSEGGVTDAYYRLGMLFEELKGKDQSCSKAIQLYSEATNKDHEGAISRLARIYHLGKGVDHDYQKAYDLYARAAELGHDESSRVLDITNYSIEKDSIVVGGFCIRCN
jgi:TPR repeat protein